MAGIPSVVECIKLANMAWTIGRAFTSGRAGAPREFQEVENELKGLTTSLNLLAETLDDDDGILSRADEKTKTGVKDILDCCGQTLHDLESFVAQYSEIKKVDIENSQVTERKWKLFFIKHWKTVVWTTEGGNIQSLRNMLHIHVESISMTMQALQSKSLTRLEATIEPMAAKINDIHFLVMSVVGPQRGSGLSLEETSNSQTEPTLPAQTPLAIEHGDEARRSYHTIFGGRATLDATLRDPSTNSATTRTSFEERYPNDAEILDRSIPEEPLSHQLTPPLSSTLYPERVTETRQLSRSESRSMSSGGSRPSSNLDIVDENGHEHVFVPSNGNYSSNHYPSPRHSHGSSTTGEQAAPSRMSSISLPPTPSSPAMLPPPMIPTIPETEPERVFSAGLTDLESVPKATSTEEEHAAFRRELFSDTITLCDLKATKIEFTQLDEETADLRMVEAASDSSIYLIRKKDTSSNVTDDEDVIPYTLWGKTERVVIKQDSLLRFHDTTFGSKPLETAKTKWVTYSFENDHASTLFQSALMNKTLILSVKTHKTLRLHPGVTGLLALQEQMCALENLRLWQDPVTGGVFAMIHYSANFRKGYMAFYVNSHQDPIRAGEDGTRFVKIKGLKLPLGNTPSMSPRKNSIANKGKSPKAKGKTVKEKLITGAKIEFTTEMDKQLFLKKLRQVQGNFFAGSDVVPGLC